MLYQEKTLLISSVISVFTFYFVVNVCIHLNPFTMAGNFCIIPPITLLEIFDMIQSLFTR
jgi:hypothetical protein